MQRGGQLRGGGSPQTLWGGAIMAEGPDHEGVFRAGAIPPSANQRWQRSPLVRPGGGS